MKANRISTLEFALISECLMDNIDFGRITKLINMGANINAVNEYGECVLALIADGYCGGADFIRSGYNLAKLCSFFISNGFDIRRHGIKTVSALQTNIYDKYARMAIEMILRRRAAILRADVKAFAGAICPKSASDKALPHPIKP